MEQENQLINLLEIIVENLSSQTDEIKCYDTSQLREIMGCGERQAKELMASQGFPSIKIGRKRVVEKSALRKWFANNKGKTYIV